MDSTLPTFKVVFAHDRDAAQQAVSKAMTVAIFPNEDRWEDQGFILGAAAVLRTHIEIVELPQLAFLSSSSHDSVETLTFDLGTQPFADANTIIGNDWWAVMLEDVSSYRDLVKRVGLPNALGALRAMHDIPAEGLLSSPAPWRALAMASTGFRVAMLRSVARYFAFRRAANVLNGNEREAIEMASAQATLRFKLDTFSSHHQIPFVFGKTKFFDHRINVLVGENGVGKSQALARIVDALEHGPASKSQFFTEGQFSRVVAFSGVPSQKSLPRRLKLNRNIQYQYFDLSPVRPPSKQLNPLTSALFDLVRDTERIEGERRINVLEEAVSNWMPLAAIELPRVLSTGEEDTRPPRRSAEREYVAVGALIGIPGPRTLQLIGEVDLFAPPMFIHRNGRRAPLSSGQELFFRLALNLCNSLETGSLVLIDEIENHLHPNFVTRLVALLRRFLEMTGSFAIIATHSPFVVREVSRKDVAIISKQEDDSPLIRRPRLQTLGASVDAVSSYVFGDELLSTLARLTAETISTNALAQEDSRELLDELKGDFSSEAIGHIRAEVSQRRRGGESE